MLRKYWNVPERQIEKSIVLADEAFMKRPSPSRDAAEKSNHKEHEDFS